jgi:hypothetical protein
MMTERDVCRRNVVKRSFRLSPELVELIEGECRAQSISFSDYVRAAIRAYLPPRARRSRECDRFSSQGNAQWNG